MKTEAQFITPSDFENYWGINLNRELKGDNYSRKAELFLLQVEDQLLGWIEANTFRNIPWDNLTEYQTEQLQLALLYQAFYIFKNSNISLDSGYDPDNGMIISPDKLASIEVNRTALNFLKNAGLYNHVVTNHRRYTTFN